MIVSLVVVLVIGLLMLWFTIALERQFTKMRKEGADVQGDLVIAFLMFTATPLIMTGVFGLMGLLLSNSVFMRLFNQ